MLILIVDDHDLVREGLRQVLKALDEGVQILEAASCESAFGLAQQYPELDLVLLDYHLPDMDGLSALEVLGREHPELPVIVLSGSSSPHLERRVIDCGGAGFVSKNGLSQQLLGVVKRVLDGEVPVLCGNTPATASPDAPTDTPASRLTPRQAEVLRLLLDGQSPLMQQAHTCRVKHNMHALDSLLRHQREARRPPQQLGCRIQRFANSIKR